MSDRKIENLYLDLDKHEIVNRVSGERFYISSVYDWNALKEIIVHHYEGGYYV